MPKRKGVPKQAQSRMDKTGHIKHKTHMSKPNLAPQTQGATPADRSLKKLRGY